MKNFTHTAEFSGRGVHALFALQNEVGRMINPNLDMLVKLFDQLVALVLFYACEVWGFHQALAAERVHLKLCKQVDM